MQKWGYEFQEVREIGLHVDQTLPLPDIGEKVLLIIQESQIRPYIGWLQTNPKTQKPFWRVENYPENKESCTVIGWLRNDKSEALSALWNSI